jgi:hypothetical protein
MVFFQLLFILLISYEQWSNVSYLFTMPLYEWIRPILYLSRPLLYLIISISWYVHWLVHLYFCLIDIFDIVKVGVEESVRYIFLC